MEMKTKSEQPILPGSTIGILGGGQLGRMLALEGKRMGYRIMILDPSPDCPAGEVADHHIVADYQDDLAAKQLIQMADVTTYEFENIDLGLVEELERRSHLPQGHQLLAVTRHRLQEKNVLKQGNIPVAPYIEVRNLDDLRTGLKQLGTPAVLKTVTGGYDGKGQWLIRTPEQGEEALQDVQEGQVRILEGYIPFVKELSVVVARSAQGDIRCFTPVENIHRNHILHMTIAPARVEPDVLKQAQELAKQVAKRLQVVGLVAVEMFLLKDQRLLVNELAPRPHNSGHFTYDACTVSQFEQHLRCICGLPLGSPRLLSPAVMVNILGEHVSALMKHLPDLPGEAKLHLYGKKERKKGRKMGHVTFLGDSVDMMINEVNNLGIWGQEVKQKGQGDGVFS